MATNVGLWDRWYGLVDPDTPEPFGDSPSYQIAADFLAGLQVADWGCGKGWLRRLIPADLYHGVDGSRSPFADEIADLAAYTTQSEGIVLRHVLEHDNRWVNILRNAARAAQHRLVVVLFTPPRARTMAIAWNPDPGVPDIAFALGDITAELAGFTVKIDTFESPRTQYGVETVILAERRPG